MHNAKGLCTTHGERLRRTGSLADPVPLSAEERFARYLPLGCKPSDCWEWTGHRTKAGYGTFQADKRVHYAHRYARERIDGPIPSGSVVMHSCDNPPCVNPDHLSIATSWSNALDKVAKGRQMRGTAQPHAVLDEASVRFIRANFSRTRRGRTTTSNVAALAEMFGVSDATIRAVVARRTWAWLTD